mgnify:CR=1 FL=1
MSHEDDWTRKDMSLVTYLEKDAAKIINFEPDTLRKWRGDGLKFPKIPRHFKVGGGEKRRTVRYRHNDLVEWLEYQVKAECGE